MTTHAAISFFAPPCNQRIVTIVVACVNEFYMRPRPRSSEHPVGGVIGAQSGAAIGYRPDGGTHSLGHRNGIPLTGSGAPADSPSLRWRDTMKPRDRSPLARA